MGNGTGHAVPVGLSRRRLDSSRLRLRCRASGLRPEPAAALNACWAGRCLSGRWQWSGSRSMWSVSAPPEVARDFGSDLNSCRNDVTSFAKLDGTHSELSGQLVATLCGTRFQHISRNATRRIGKTPTPTTLSFDHRCPLDSCERSRYLAVKCRGAREVTSDDLLRQLLQFQRYSEKLGGVIA